MNRVKQLLEQLMIYKFLTVNQFMDLGRDQSKKTLYQNLKLLEEKKLIQVNKFGYHPNYGRLESIYYLTEK